MSPRTPAGPRGGDTSGARSAPGGATYAGAGVDIAAGDAAVARIGELVASTHRPEVLGGIGGFGGSFAFDPTRYRAPVLVSSTDGVGTKSYVAAATGRYGTIGVDLVAMCVDDIVCVGAEPLFLLDYVTTGKLDPDQMEELVSGVATGCRAAGCALLGGEMAEHPGSLPPGEFDLAGFTVGVVERDRMLGRERVVVGDVLVGLLSPGLRCNGYTLARHVLLERAGLGLDDPAWPGAPHTLADELLAPSVVYAPAVLAALRALGSAAATGAAAAEGAATGAVHAAAHVTGGGLPGNLGRVIPGGADAVVDRGAWEEPRIFDEIRRLGDVDEAEMARVFNLGIGMVLVVAAADAARAVDALGAAGCPAVVMGRVSEGTGRVRLEGTRPGRGTGHPGATHTGDGAHTGDGT
ncbi:MAG TPA: phosphoribosylformylglycinamidine cyclo-ligase [Acidimicrobiales bacterium]|nr:phosphoribosylformylglycinamidine cyclo-ligase [Acidimicrobiales bacterium]